MLMNVSSNLIVGCLAVSFWCLALEEVAWGEVTHKESSSSRQPGRKPYRQAPCLRGTWVSRNFPDSLGHSIPPPLLPNVPTTFKMHIFLLRLMLLVEKRELKWKTKRARFGTCQVFFFFFWLSVFLFRAGAHPGNLPLERPGTTLPTKAGKGLGDWGRCVEGASFPPGRPRQLPPTHPTFLKGAPCLPTSWEPMKQYGICSALQMISPRRLWHLSDLPTSQQDHKFSPTLLNNIKNYIFVGWESEEGGGKKTQRILIACSKSNSSSVSE